MNGKVRKVWMMPINGHRDVWIKMRNIGIAMVANDVLVDPIISWHNKDNKMRGKFIDPWCVREREMRGIVSSAHDKHEQKKREGED